MINKLVLSLALAGSALIMQPAAAETVRLCSPADYTVLGISDNGNWAVGMYGNAMSEMHSFRWNLVTNEIEVSGVPSECGTSIADDGTYCGGFPYTDENGRTFVSPGYYDGSWHALPLPEGSVNDAFDGAISPDGRHMAITVELNGKYQIAQYEDCKFVRILKSDNDHSRVYDITDDGGKICGWTYAHIGDLSVNRTGVYWEGDSDYKIIDENAEDPHRSPWAGVRRFSSDGNHALFYGGWVAPNDGPAYILGIKNLQTGEVAPLYPVDERDEDFQVDDFADDMTVVGTYDYVASITQNGKTSYLVDWLLENKGIDARKEWTDVMNYEGTFMLNRATCIQHNGKAIGIVYNGADMEMHSMVLKFDVTIGNCAPAELKVSEVEKAGAVRLDWVMPYGMDLSKVKGYNIYRDGEKITQEVVTGTHYFDAGLEAGKEYSYQVTAIYEDGESDLSVSESVVVKGIVPEKPASLLSRQKGMNSVSLSWNEPYTNLVQKHYFDNESVTEGFGTSELNITAEAGVKFDYEELSLYGNAKISAVEFYPMSKQQNWKVNVYSEDEAGKLTKLASHKVTQELKLRERNVFQLPEAIEMPEGSNLVVSVSFTVVDESSMQSVIGMQFGKAIEGYSDLLRREVIPPEDFQSLAVMAQGSGMNMIVSWKIGVILTPEGMSPDIDSVDRFVVSRDGNELYSGKDMAYIDRNLSDGTYNYGVKTVYSDGRVSEEAVVSQKVAARSDEAYSAQEVSVSVQDDNINVAWKEPVDTDLTDVTWSHGSKSGNRIVAAANNYNLQAAAIYPSYLFTGLDGYNIAGARFFPTCDATYTVIIDNGVNTEPLVYYEVDSFSLNEWNTVYFDEPVALSPNTTYRMIIDCYDVEDNGSPLAVDDSKGVDGLSCLINVTSEEEQWQEVSATIGVSCNWMMGLLMADPVPGALLVKGYDVTVDGRKLNDDLIKETSYSHPVADIAATAGNKHSLTVDTWYEPLAKAVPGLPVEFILEDTGIDGTFVADIMVSCDGAVVKVTDAESIAIYDVNGMKVASEYGDSVRIDAIPDGIYVVKASTVSGKSVVTKINIRR